MNSDSTRTFDQAQSSSSDAAAEQQRQEIESLKAEAAQVPCGASSYCSPLCIVFLFSWLLEKLSSQTHIQVQCDPTRYSSSKKSLLKLRRRKYHTMLVGLQRRERIDWIDDLIFFRLSWLVGWIGGQIKFSCMLGLRVKGSSRPLKVISCQNLQVCSGEELSITNHHKKKKIKFPFFLNSYECTFNR